MCSGPGSTAVGEGVAAQDRIDGPFEIAVLAGVGRLLQGQELKRDGGEGIEIGFGLSLPGRIAQHLWCRVMEGAQAS